MSLGVLSWAGHHSPLPEGWQELCDTRCGRARRCHLRREGNTIPVAKSGKCLGAARVSHPHLSPGTLLWLLQVLWPFRWHRVASASSGSGSVASLAPGVARCPSSTDSPRVTPVSPPAVTAGLRGQLGGEGQLWGSSSWSHPPSAIPGRWVLAEITPPEGRRGRARNNRAAEWRGDIWEGEVFPGSGPAVGPAQPRVLCSSGQEKRIWGVERGWDHPDFPSPSTPPSPPQLLHLPPLLCPPWAPG